MKSFWKNVTGIAVPVALQSLLQSSFSVVDQVMIGALGSAGIAGVGLGGKFASMYAVVLGAVAAAAGIMMAQYMGRENREQFQACFTANLRLAAALALACTLLCLAFPGQIMGLYTKDAAAHGQAAAYLRLYCLAFLPLAVTSLASVLLRCLDAAALPLAASLLSVLLNTGMNYLLIFGNCGFPRLGVEGAAIASVLSQLAACALTLFFCTRKLPRAPFTAAWPLPFGRVESACGLERALYVRILAPILICEFLWSLGENVYGAIYGHIGTDPCAAMTMTGAVQGLTVGLLSGLSQAASLIVGKSLGNGDCEKAYAEARQLLRLGLAGSLLLSGALAVCGKYYVRIYSVGPEVQAAAYRILLVFALFFPVKVQNMILGGGIIRSGGKTGYVMWIDLIGTWLCGVPLGLLAAFAWKLPIVQVYCILSLEELVRLLLSIVLFRTRRWMGRL
ncbi:MAG: MATE family efflux transporter [Oscillospiraceae bacterium]|nr:MATE family efflux transporter [Oscillospiraceae bacterium]